VVISRIFLGITAAVFIAFGLWGLLSPVEMVREFGISLGGADGATMIRASYGGFLIGEGALFAWCAMSSQRERFGLSAVILLTLPILLSRLLGMALDGAPSPYHRAYAGIELIGVCVALFLLRRENK
jgi:Domain of unknown function (DUF4345)